MYTGQKHVSARDGTCVLNTSMRRRTKKNRIRADHALNITARQGLIDSINVCARVKIAFVSYVRANMGLALAGAAGATNGYFSFRMASFSPFALDGQGAHATTNYRRFRLTNVIGVTKNKWHSVALDKGMS